MALAAKTTASLARPAVDLRRLVPDVRNQGPRPLCVPFSLTAMHEAARVFLHGAASDDALAVEPIWQRCLNNGRAGVYGTTIPDAAEALDNRGQPAEATWPYNAALGAGTESDPPTTADVDWYRANLADLPLAHDGIEDLIELALSAGFPVVILIELTAEFEYPNPGGEIDAPLITSPLGDYHAVVAVGAATTADGTSRRLLVRNSWGRGWGAGGYGWLPLEYLTAFAVEAAVLDPRTMITY